MDNPNFEGMSASQPKKSNTGLIIAVVVAVVLCCCCIIIVAGGYYLQSTVDNVFSSVNEQLTALPDTIMTVAPDMPSLPDATSIPLDMGDVVPNGGLGDDVLRATAWSYSILASVTNGCNVPVAKDTKIEVTQQPDSAGVWMERWTVACEGSASVPVDITFTPASGGGTDISVTLAK